METEALRGMGCTGVPRGTSKQNGPKGNEGIRLSANLYQPPSTFRRSVFLNHDAGSTRYSSASFNER
jgi:hypothetical protein